MTDTDLLALVYFDGFGDFLNMLKNGAAAVWKAKNDLLPQFGPLIDKGIAAAKPLIAAMTGN